MPVPAQSYQVYRTNCFIDIATHWIPDSLEHFSDPFRGAGLEDSLIPTISAFQHESMADNSGELESAFEFGLELSELRASTPKAEQQSHSLISTGSMIGESGENVVLRIDNVPWVRLRSFFNKNHLLIVDDTGYHPLANQEMAPAACGRGLCTLGLQREDA